MAVKIRLSRIGTTNRPFYRLIAVDARKKRDGAQLANIGTFDPVNGVVVQFHEELYQEWLSKGALATDSAKKMYRLYKKNSSHSVQPGKPVAETTVAQKETTEKAA